MSEKTAEAERVAREKWNALADNFNQWDALDQDEKNDLIEKELRGDRVPPGDACEVGFGHNIGTSAVRDPVLPGPTDVFVPGADIFRVIRHLLDFPSLMISRHSVAEMLLDCLERNGFSLSKALAEAVAFAHDGEAFALLEKTNV